MLCLRVFAFLTVVIISLSAIFAINPSWHDNLRQFYLRCFRGPFAQRGVTAVSVCRRNKRQMHSVFQPVNTAPAASSRDQNRTGAFPGFFFFVHCVTKLHLTSGGKNCLIDEQSNSLHVINTLLMAIHLSSIPRCKTQRKIGRGGGQIVMEAPNWPPCHVKDWVSFARFCYLMACFGKPWGQCNGLCNG